ncbi:hypothetical protein L6452_04105 [Arctium lappa]|uniref:Uncharacterized protein n=1 Tax=Arctium lappa TaxID=4217 RepID=A0ACB9FQ14_ARCLA|nr:hypothetical protein L6452_04105 [Arctium lappa]
MIPPPPVVAATISLNHHKPPSATTNPPPADESTTTIITIQDNSTTTTSSGHIGITINRNAPPFLIPNHKFYNFRGLLYLIYGVALVVMYPTLAQLTQLKFQNYKQSPFEALSFFANTTVVAYTTAILSSVALFYLIPQLENSTKERVSRIYYIYVILKSVFYFSSILAPLSLVLVLLIPPKFIWIGYIVIFALFIAIVVCNFSDYIKLVYKKDGSNLGDVQID